MEPLERGTPILVTQGTRMTRGEFVEYSYNDDGIADAGVVRCGITLYRVPLEQLEVDTEPPLARERVPRDLPDGSRERPVRPPAPPSGPRTPPTREEVEAARAAAAAETETVPE